MMRIHSHRARRGYTLTVVLLTLIMLFLLWSYATRTTSSLLRLETDRVLQQTRDQGAMNALGQAIQLLEYSQPSSTSNPNQTVFTYGVSISVPSNPPGGGCTTSSFVVTYTKRTDLGQQRWQVQVAPGSCSTSLPSIGANPQWP